MQHEPTTLAYLAGAIDADGHITVQRSLRKQGKRYTHSPTYYLPKIGYTSTDEVVPILLSQTFGGSIYQHRPRNPSHRLVYNWSITTAASGGVARLLIPYLRQKRKQAELRDGIELPTKFVLGLPVYFGDVEREIHAFLRWRMDEGSLTLGIQLHRLEHVRQAVFKGIVQDVADRTSCPAVFGKSEN
jgi:hypothetical protein